MSLLSPEKEKILRSLFFIQQEIRELPNEKFQRLLRNLDKRVRDYFNSAETREKNQEETIHKLQKEVADLKEKVNYYKRALAEAHATRIWESHATRFVISPSVKQAKFSQYKQMTKYFKKEEKFQNQPSMYRWDKLQRVLGFQWTDDHYQLVQSIRETRNNIAHPSHIDLEDVKESLMEDALKEEQECIEDLFDMLKLTASLMKYGKLANDYLTYKHTQVFRHIHFTRPQVNTLRMMADWDRDLQHVQNGRLHCMENATTLRYLKKYVHYQEYSKCAKVIKIIEDINRDRLAKLVWKFDTDVRERVFSEQNNCAIDLIEETSPEWEKLSKITQNKVWSPAHTNALDKMKSFLPGDSKDVDIPDPETAKCIIPGVLEKSLWRYGLDIVDWYTKMKMGSRTMTTRSSRKRNHSTETVHHSKRPRRSPK